MSVDKEKFNRIDFLLEGLAVGCPPFALREQYCRRYPESKRKFNGDMRFALKVLKKRTEKQRPQMIAFLRVYANTALELALARAKEGKLNPVDIVKILEYIGKLYAIDSELKPVENAPEPLRIILQGGAYGTQLVGGNDSAVD